jgi:uncharacterized SAM-binding protein YcdF (DUF218 family)
MASQIRDMAGPGATEAVAMGWNWHAGMMAEPSLQRPLVRGLILVALAVSVLVGVVGLGGFLFFVNSIDRYERAPAARTDAIVALTGGAQRIGDAIDLLGKGYANRLLITGVNERTSRDEIARFNPGQRRMFDCCVDLDYRARNTIGNAIETRHWMERNGFRSLIVVTSNYHMARTLVELDHVLPDIRKVPFAVVTGSLALDGWWHRPSTAKLLAYEYVKLLAVYFRTRFESDPERAANTMLMGGRKPLKRMAEPFRSL